MRFLRGTWYVFLRHLKATARMPVFVIISIVQPIFWLMLFGQLFGKVVQLPGFETSTYPQFLAPGIAVMSSLFGSSFAGMGLLADMNSGVLERFLATPLQRAALIAGRLLDVAAQATIQAAVLLVFSYFLGASSEGGLLGLFFVLLASALTGSSLGALSKALALVARRQEAVLAVMNFLVLPMVFLSTMIMARELMPGWMGAVATVNPIDWAVELARRGFEGKGLAATLPYLAKLVAFTLVCYGLAVGALRVYQKSQ